MNAHRRYCPDCGHDERDHGSLYGANKRNPALIAGACQHGQCKCLAMPRDPAQ